MEMECFFCPSTKHLADHHLIPQKLLGDWVPYGIITVCQSCHQIIEDMTRCYIWNPTNEEEGELAHRSWEDKKRWAKILKKDSYACQGFNKKWLDIYNYFVEEVIPLWEVHKKKTVAEIIGLEEESIFVPPPPPIDEGVVREISHWWEVPTPVLRNHADSGLGDPRKANWKEVIDNGKIYYQVAK